MPEFVEHSRHLIKAEKRRGILSRFAEIAYVDDDRTYILTGSCLLLIADIVHPRPAALCLTRKIVRQENADQGTVRISYLERLHIRMIYRDILYLLYIDSVQPVCRLEDTMTDILHTEIRSCLIFVQSIFALADLLRIIRPVPSPYHG